MERGVIGHVVQIGKIGVRQKVAIREKRATPAEVILWKEIRNRNPGGLKFRRQYPVLGFILDFYCVEKSLGIEYHKQKIFPSQSCLYFLRRTCGELPLTMDRIFKQKCTTMKKCRGGVKILTSLTIQLPLGYKNYRTGKTYIMIFSRVMWKLNLRALI